MDSLVSYGYHQKGLVDADELSIDSSTIAAKKGRSRRLAMTATIRKRKEAKYMQ
jgi:hypothetical protein